MKYRVACFSMHYPPQSDSEGYVTAKFVDALRQQGHIVDVFSFSEPTESVDRLNRYFVILRDIAENVFRAKKLNTMELSQIGPLTRGTQHLIGKFEQKHCVEAYDIIVSRYEPIGSAIAAYWVQRSTGLPWIASYSDPLPRRMPGRQGLIGLWDAHKRGFQTRWFNRLIGTPNWLVFASARLRDWVLNNASNAGLSVQTLMQQSSVIPHIGGPIGARSEKSGKGSQQDFTVRHLGYMSPLRDPGTLLAALDLWESCPGLPLIKVEFIGNTFAQREAFGRFLITPRTRVELQLLPEVSQDEAFYLMQTADVCLLIEERSKESIFLPSKFCDYAVAGKPILVITNQAATVIDYLRKLGGGEVATHSDPDNVFSLLKGFMHKGQDGSATLANQFSPRTIAMAWEEAFEAVGCLGH